MSRLFLALALAALAGGAWADTTEPKRDSQQPASAATQEKQEPNAAQPSAAPEAAAAPAPVETRGTASNDAYGSQGRRHPGASQAEIDFVNRYYPGG